MAKFSVPSRCRLLQAFTLGILLSGSHVHANQTATGPWKCEINEYQSHGAKYTFTIVPSAEAYLYNGRLQVKFSEISNGEAATGASDLDIEIFKEIPCVFAENDPQLVWCAAFKQVPGTDFQRYYRFQSIKRVNTLVDSTGTVTDHRAYIVHISSHELEMAKLFSNNHPIEAVFYPNFLGGNDSCGFSAD